MDRFCRDGAQRAAPLLVLASWLMLAGDGVWEGASGAFAMAEFLDGGLEVGYGEIGPTLGEEDKFGEGALPEEKVGQALLAAGADEEIDFRRAAVEHLGENAAERVGREGRDFVEAAGGAKDGFASGVVDGQA